MQWFEHAIVRFNSMMLIETPIHIIGSIIYKGNGPKLYLILFNTRLVYWYSDLGCLSLKSTWKVSKWILFSFWFSSIKITKMCSACLKEWLPTDLPTGNTHVYPYFYYCQLSIKVKKERKRHWTCTAVIFY